MKKLLLIAFTLLFSLNSYAGIVDSYQERIQTLLSGVPATQGALQTTVLSNIISQPLLLSIEAFSLPGLIGAGSVAATSGILLVKKKLQINSYAKMIVLYHESMDAEGPIFDKFHKKVSKKSRLAIDKHVLADRVLKYFDESNKEVGDILVKFDHKKQKEKLLTYRKFRKLLVKEFKASRR